MKILIFDNYDSFTYNLVHLVEKILHQKVEVFRNDRLELDRVKDFDKIILSPGPGVPAEAGMLLPLIKAYAPIKPILGVCLGHQAIGEAFGARLENLATVFHGVATTIRTTPYSAPYEKVNRQLPPDHTKNLFSGMPETFMAGRYHSWIVSNENFPQELEVTARDENNYIMALRHRHYDVQGVQFHPESILTPKGETIMRNWLEL